MKREKLKAGFFIGMITVSLMLLAILFVIKFSGLRICNVSGDSMMPTLTNNERLVIHPKTDVRRFDIIVFQTDNQYLIKRVIGLPGDTVTVTNGVLEVNGEHYQEQYLDDDNVEEFRYMTFEVNVPDDKYFVLGDNRDNSTDSRKFGMIDKDTIIGVTIMTLDEHERMVEGKK